MASSTFIRANICRQWVKEILQYFMADRDGVKKHPSAFVS